MGFRSLLPLRALDIIPRIKKDVCALTKVYLAFFKVYVKQTHSGWSTLV